MKRLWIIPALWILTFAGCREDDDPQQAAIEPPTQVKLIFPLENSECNEGINVTETESTVLFEWRSADFTDEYQLVLTDLNSGQEGTFTTTEIKIPIVLQRASPYAWYVISKSNSTDSSATSDTWRFYNAGDGIESYAPFPADIISPPMAARISSTSSVVLEWNGNDVDNDIAGYDVYFGTQSDPPLFAGDVQNTGFNVAVTPNTIYYWRIVTRDDQGHESDSGIFQFKVE